MDIVELPPTDLDARPELVEGLVALRNAVIAVDSPWVHPATATTVTGFLRHGWDGEPGRCFVGVMDGEVVAEGAVHTSEWDNRDLAWLGLQVHPARRGRGLASRLADHLERVATDMGRTKLGSDAWDGSAGVGFAQARGFAVASRAVNRRQHLPEVALDKVEAMYDDAAAAAVDYELVRLVGYTPEDLLDAVATMTAAINDAPLDDLQLEDEVFPPARVRAYERATLERGHRLYRLLARHRHTGELAGHTVVAVEAERPEIGHQHDTSVVRSHRGHRLGLLLKSAMNLWLAEVEPQLRSVDTWNAESNDHMIAVNEALGYRWMGRELQFQRT